MIFFVSDFFACDVLGGAELTTEALLEDSLMPIKRVRSSQVTSKLVNENIDKKWIFGNFSGVPDELLLLAAKKLEYSVIEYDYKFCKYRSTHKHEQIEGACKCDRSTHGKIISIFFKSAKNIFWMSAAQRDVYLDAFPFLRKANNIVLSSVFSEESIQFILSLDTSNKSDNYLILNSESWIKGTKECIEYAEAKGIPYELVGGLSHKDLLKKLASSKGLIFLPQGLDTCPRIVIESKLLGCDLILNDYVQHKDEDWFKGDIIEYVRAQKKLFFNNCLDIKFCKPGRERKNKFHFVIPVYNSEKFISKTIRSIKNQKHGDYTVSIVDDVSTDRTLDVIRREIGDDDRFSVISNQEKSFALCGISKAISKLNPGDEDIIFVLDGDDWLSSSSVLDVLEHAYSSDSELLLTYGSYIEHPSALRGPEPSEYPKDVIRNNTFRKDMWRASHPKTFKYKLWKGIDQKDFLDVDGEFFKTSYDQALMLPLLEMAQERIKFIPELLYVYNKSNPNHHNRGKEKVQYETMLRVREKKTYGRINLQ